MPLWSPRRRASAFSYVVRRLPLLVSLGLLLIAAAAAASLPIATAFVPPHLATLPSLPQRIRLFRALPASPSLSLVRTHTSSSITMSSSKPSSTPPPSSSLLITTLLKTFELVGKSTRWTVASLVAIVLLVRRDAAMVNFTGGAILNALLGKTLKRIIKEARPDGAVLEDPGMPSSHAMALFYMTSFITAALCESKGLGGALPPWWPFQYTTTIFSVVLYVLTASSWRVFSGLHTPAQIVVGAGVGSAGGLGWQYVCRTRVNGEVGRWLQGRFEGGRVPLSYLLGVMFVGALTVGSVERKIAKAMRRILHDGRKEGGKEEKER